MTQTPVTEPTSLRERTDLLLADLETESSTDLAHRAQIEESVVLLNLGLADAIASRYVGRGIDRDDLVQVARLGLVRAVHRYRPGLGQSFAGYAAPTIAGEIKRHFRDTGWMVRPPRRLQELGAHLRLAEKSLEQRLHRPPTVPELAREMGVEEAQVTAARTAASSFHAISLDTPNPSGGEGPGERLAGAGDDPYAALDDRAWLAAALGRLSDRERTVLRLRFAESLTQSEIAELIGVSQMQVSRILHATLARLRQVLEPSIRLAS